MKYFLNMAILLITFINIKVQAQFISAQVYIDGLTCSLCSKGVEKSLLQLPYISNVAMDLNTNLAEITFKQPAVVDINQISKKVSDAGFSVRSMEAKYNFEELLIFEGSTFFYFESTFIFRDVQKQVLTGVHRLIFIGKNFMDRNTFEKYKNATVLKEGQKQGTTSYSVTL